MRPLKKVHVIQIYKSFSLLLDTTDTLTGVAKNKKPSPDNQ